MNSAFVRLVKLDFVRLVKLERNAECDRQQTDALAAAGWTVLRFWEHESQEDVFRCIIKAMAAP